MTQEETEKLKFKYQYLKKRNKELVEEIKELKRQVYSLKATNKNLERDAYRRRYGTR